MNRISDDLPQSKESLEGGGTLEQALERAQNMRMIPGALPTQRVLTSIDAPSLPAPQRSAMAINVPSSLGRSSLNPGVFQSMSGSFFCESIFL